LSKTFIEAGVEGQSPRLNERLEQTARTVNARLR
jgi:hypothetical protein